MPVDTAAVIAWFDELARVAVANRDWLTELDSAIGDADHGVSMERGFTAVKTELHQNVFATPGAALKSAAMVLIKTMGGASGPLLGTFFLRAAASAGERATLDGAALAHMFRAGADGIAARGKAQAGEKTMLDALLPAVAALEETGGDLAAAANAAGEGATATIPLIARKGRASYLGPRSAGHQDPGATSIALLMRAAADCWR